MTATGGSNSSNNVGDDGGANAGALNGVPSSAAPSMDGLKASTSRMASNLAHMAQRAVQNAVGGTTLDSAGSNITTASATATGTAGATFTGSASIHSPPQQLLQPAASTAPATATAMSALPELDAEAKMALIHTHVGDLIPGERVIMFLTNVSHVSDSSGFQSSSSSQVWCCAMTYFRLLLFATHPANLPSRPSDWNAAAWPHESPPTVLQMPLASMDRVEKSVFTVSGTASYNNNAISSGNNASGMMMMMMVNVNNSAPPLTNTSQQHMGVVVSSKLPYGRQIRFSTANYQDTSRAYEALQSYAFPGRRNLGYLFAFESKREKVMASVQIDATGQSTVTLEPCARRFDAVLEFQRQFVNAHHALAPVSGGESLASPQSDTISNNNNNSNNNYISNNNPWSIWTTTNASYQLCQSYPSVLVGPASLDEQMFPDAARIVRQCAAFRSEHRLPALTWCGPGGASVWRCSQPKVGLQGNRSTADELFLQHIAERAAAA